MNTTTAAETHQVSATTIRRWCRTGKLTATKVAGRWIIDTPAAEEERVEYQAGHIEMIGGREVMLFHPKRWRRAPADEPRRWSYVVDEHADTIPEVTYATAERALGAARAALSGTPQSCLTCGPNPATCDCY